MSLYYLLDENGEPYGVDTPPEFEDWYNRWHLVDKVNGCHVSTVFLIVDHNIWGGRPILFETMVFDGEDKGIYLDHYCDIESAKKGHEYAKSWVKNGCKENEA